MHVSRNGTQQSLAIHYSARHTAMARAAVLGHWPSQHLKHRLVAILTAIGAHKPKLKPRALHRIRVGKIHIMVIATVALTASAATIAAVAADATAVD